MSPSSAPLPKPTPFDAAAAAALAPPRPAPDPPAVFRVVTLSPGEDVEIGFVYKRTYQLDSVGQPERLVDEQPPLNEEATFHEPLSPGTPPSCRSLPEVIAFKTGTDVVVRASARPPRTSREWLVSVGVGPHVHAARVFGRRFCEATASGLPRFSTPEPFDEMPLRLENAYGGRDIAFEAAVMQEVVKKVTPEAMRQARPSLEAIFGANHPLMYPRNRFGKGYVLGPSLDGRELPTIERPDDLLTPERLVLTHPLNWTVQPLPAAFDYMDPFTFPRSAMLGFPPPSAKPLNEDLLEVRAGLIPADFCRGSLLAHRPQDMAACLHLWGSRCAPPGLCLPFLNGDESLLLSGMDPGVPELKIPLPRQRPEVTLPGWLGSGPTLHGQLHLVFVDVDARLLSLIWSARTPLRRTIMPGQMPDITAAYHLRMRGV